MPNTSEALLKVIGAPEKDEPRLSLAAELEQAKDPRGAFIRIQCELARMATDDPRRPELMAEERRLKARHGRGWMEELKLPSDPQVVATFVRGFVEEVTGLRPKDFSAAVDRIATSTPLRKLSLQGRGVDVEALPAQLAALPALRSLELCNGQMDDGSLEKLLLDPALRGLARFALDGMDCAERMVRVVLESPALGNVTSLGLTRGSNRGWNNAKVMSSLLASDRLLDLESLQLSNDMTGPELKKLVRHLDSSKVLRELDVGCNKVRGAGIKALVTDGGCLRLRSLSVYSNSLSAASVTDLSRASTWISLESLDLGGNALGSNGIKALVKGAAPGGLRTLQLINNKLDDVALKELGRWPGLAGVRELNLCDNAWKGAGLLALLASEHLGSLESLDASYSHEADGAQLVGLRDLRPLPRLRQLDLSGTAFDDQAATALANWPGAASLCSLGLGYTKVGDAGGQALAESKNLSPHCALAIGVSGLEKSVLGMLRDRFGDLLKETASG